MPLRRVGSSLPAVGLALLVGCGDAGPTGATDAGAAIDAGTDAGTPAVTLGRVAVRDAAARNAVCNDGSDAVYFLRRGVGAGAQRWVILLDGGKFCSNNADCDGRAIQAPQLMSSVDRPATVVGAGLLSVDPVINPDFWDANHVEVAYCSSDNWSGDRAASAVTNGRAFRGRAIMRALIEDLCDPAITAAPTLEQSESLLLAGGSAGGIGVLANLDAVAGQLPVLAVRGFTDAGWFIHIDPYVDGTPGLLEWMQEGLSHWSAQVDASCAAAHPSDAHLCYFGADLLPFLTTPLLVHASQRDANIISSLGVTAPPDASELGYIESYATALLSSVQAAEAVFANAGPEHTLIDSERFATALVAGESLRDLLGRWYFDRGGSLRLIE